MGPTEEVSTLKRKTIPADDYGEMADEAPEREERLDNEYVVKSTKV